MPRLPASTESVEQTVTADSSVARMSESAVYASDGYGDSLERKLMRNHQGIMSEKVGATGKPDQCLDDAAAAAKTSIY